MIFNTRLMKPNIKIDQLFLIMAHSWGDLKVLIKKITAKNGFNIFYFVKIFDLLCNFSITLRILQYQLIFLNNVIYK